MVSWIKSLLGYTDRASAAGARLAQAWEDIADMSEAVRDEMRARLGGGKALAAAPDDETPKKGRK